MGGPRGYDFEGVCKWFAERADVILLFFDPDKPGTTGETLSILTKSLAGMDHKLYIVLNKVGPYDIHTFLPSSLRHSQAAIPPPFDCFHRLTSSARSTTSRAPTARCAGT